MAQAPINSSTLVIPEPKVEQYIRDFEVPRKSILKDMIERVRDGGLVYSRLKFDHGSLSKVEHSWSVTFFHNEISVEMDLQLNDEKNSRYTLKPSYLELMYRGNVKSRHAIVFQPISHSPFSQTTLWYGYWLNDGSWDECVDRVRVTLQACKEEVGICYESTLWYEKSAESYAVFGSYLEQDYKGSFLDTHVPDVTVICSGSDKTFPAHKEVLVNRSPVFKEFFSTETEEKDTITINGFDPEVVKAFLKFLYSGCDLDFDLLEEPFCNSLFDVACFYKVEALKMLCENQLIDKVTKANCVKYFQKSVHMDAPLLKDECWDILTKDYKEILFRNKENFKIFATEFPELLLDLAGFL